MDMPLPRPPCCRRRTPAPTPQALANWLGLLALLALGVVWPV
jgi:hypothetical protein